MNNYFPTILQEVVYKSRYARWRDDLGRREDWPETVGRYFDFFEEHLAEKNGFKLKKDLRSELEEAVLNLKVMPSMRALMTAGPALKRDNIAAYNCSYLPIDHPRAFDEILWILMNGVGVGFSVEHKEVDKLPIVNEHFEKTNSTIVVEDSKQGWAKGLRELIAMLYAGQIPSWDLSKLRPAGAILKTFGGRSSGPDPLNELFEFTINKFTKASGRRLMPIECHDIICMIGQVVVVGGVRRSALISLSNLDDRYMQEAKSGRWWDLEGQRALANNSSVYSRTPDVVTFIEEFTSLIKSQSGERGIYNRQAAIKQVTKSGRRDINQRFGVNPCVSADTLILTTQGYIPIKEIVGNLVSVWNGEEWSEVTPFETGIQDTLFITFSDGTSLRCTPNHKFIIDKKGRVEAENLIIGDKLAKYSMPRYTEGCIYPGDAYSQGFYSGDGNTGLEYSWLYDTKFCCEKRLYGVTKFEANITYRKKWVHGPMFAKNWVPINGVTKYKLNWLAGLLDSDGCVTRDKNGNGLQIGSIDLDFLNAIRLMLTTIGVQAKVVKARDAGQYYLPKNDGTNTLKLYDCKKSYRLLIGNQDTYRLVNSGLKTDRLDIHDSPPQRDARRFVYVVSIEESTPCETYCFNEPKNHTGTFNGIVTGQCGEIVLRPNGLCNLSESIIRPNDTIVDLKEKTRVATILGTFQSTLTDFKYLRKIWKDNAEEERLLGVSQTGIFDREELYPEQLEELKNVAIETNKELAVILKIPQSTAITCVKPSGTVSQLVNASSGIHPRHSKYYIRTIRGDKKDPLTKFLIDSGIPYEDDITKPADTLVFSFPQKSPNNITRETIGGAIKHLKYWLKYKNHYCEHNPSVTISVKEDEWLEVAAWVYSHFEDILGISFLPYSEHTYKQAPYQECTKEQYEEVLSKMPKEIDWTKLTEYEKEDYTVGSQELSCSAGGCEIK